MATNQNAATRTKPNRADQYNPPETGHVRSRQTPDSLRLSGLPDRCCGGSRIPGSSRISGRPDKATAVRHTADVAQGFLAGIRQCRMRSPENSLRGTGAHLPIAAASAPISTARPAASPARSTARSAARSASLASARAGALSAAGRVAASAAGIIPSECTFARG
jgi:hypothetical protein